MSPPVQSLHEQSRILATDIGTMVEGAKQDTKGRILLNPILSYLEERLGDSCHLDNFKKMRPSLLEKLAAYNSIHLEDLYTTNGGFGDGTW